MPIWNPKNWAVVTDNNASVLLDLPLPCCPCQFRNLPDNLVNAVSTKSASIVSTANKFSRTFPIHTMTPIWIFPAYPLLLLAPLAANLIDALPDAGAAQRIHSVTIALGASCVQGTGFLVSLMIYSAFIYRLMTQKLPRETTRPGMVSLCFPPYGIIF
jgi:tellurite resistance protein TehA-like permease